MLWEITHMGVGIPTMQLSEFDNRILRTNLLPPEPVELLMWNSQSTLY